MGKSNCHGQSKPEKICGTCRYFNPEFPVNGKPAPVCLALKIIKGERNTPTPVEPNRIFVVRAVNTKGGIR